MGPASSQRATEKNIVRAIDIVAERLGNTRSVCRKYYVHPALLAAYQQGRTAPLPAPVGPPPTRKRRESPPPALRLEEVAVLQFLQEEAPGPLGPTDQG
jgi:DNA topoisomerase-1